MKIKKKEEITFAGRMSYIKAIFKTAHEDASKLKVEMEKEIDNKNLQIEKLQTEISDINVTKKEAEEFIHNLEKFI